MVISIFWLKKFEILTREHSWSLEKYIFWNAQFLKWYTGCFSSADMKRRCFFASSCHGKFSNQPFCSKGNGLAFDLSPDVIMFMHLSIVECNGGLTFVVTERQNYTDLWPFRVVSEWTLESFLGTVHSSQFACSRWKIKSIWQCISMQLWKTRLLSSQLFRPIRSEVKENKLRHVKIKYMPQKAGFVFDFNDWKGSKFTVSATFLWTY